MLTDCKKKESKDDNETKKGGKHLKDGDRDRQKKEQRLRETRKEERENF